ncbi:hypothetical protein [Brassicibacter mesophilus]|uniref:hypothetical protein n=1 Tax=Brassicibacter mesophilus TaxID=745119 RepID=UPI003D254718
MNKKFWKRYFIYSILIISIAFIGEFAFRSVRLNFSKTFRFNPYTYNFLAVFLYGAIGVLLGLEYFLQQLKKKGRWKMNLPKLILIGVPALYFSLYSLLYYSPFQFIGQIISIPITFLIEGVSSYLAVFQVILGYVAITSFFKCDKNEV